MFVQLKITGMKVKCDESSLTALIRQSAEETGWAISLSLSLFLSISLSQQEAELNVERRRAESCSQALTRR